MIYYSATARMGWRLGCGIHAVDLIYGGNEKS